MAALNQEQRQTLHVLAFMFFRMGLMERAGRIYDGLRALSSPGQPDRLALAGLAAIALEKGDGATALGFLRQILGAGALPSRQAVFLLLKAQALWLEGRKEESRAALDEYLFLNSGEGESA
jgi:hypothetical protein